MPIFFLLERKKLGAPRKKTKTFFFDAPNLLFFEKESRAENPPGPAQSFSFPSLPSFLFSFSVLFS
ncbi:hypothetical protein COU38_01070 [Candidatus Micrarchaeota archaeon CG10_big_fil_rev_8_21_14_0_10_54_18]|nr:MAG: hypothetical protein COT57_01250 [Candidatus Micrarchaeota archaeon CG09_land_8_20_14_0_10_55_25]PJD01433.1 MAG: hypothetical protein COU38_01070 [Candidatus Micrarchaeota archaeon CG10_big_fil_rev_8_21_14_0_10_54_18]